MKRRQIGWLDEELAWIEANRTRPRAELHSAFCFRFGRKDVSRETLSALCKRKGWLTGRDGRIQPGSVPLNKGKRMPFNANSAATQFRKGQRPHTAKDVGYESIDKYGYVRICVAEPNPWTGAPKRMVHKHRWLWEREHGPVPQGHALKCLDGNKLNTDPANWKAVPREILPRLNGRFGRNYDAAAPEIKPVIMATANLEHAARLLRNGGRNG
ncbi:MAG: HNH endonuclease signature motif containing protein [bacterium]